MKIVIRKLLPTFEHFGRIVDWKRNNNKVVGELRDLLNDVNLPGHW